MNVEIRLTRDGGQELWIDGKWCHRCPTGVDGNTAAHIIARYATLRGFEITYRLLKAEEWEEKP